ncbi:hypothetical protein JI721_03880 [Alicyclobacillus cycloheptanicus]|uniref:DUF4405 domain-containing protein n=1 Tax=Alicyclobacillus cycloheptanicus TaxID=1457 RepID=A0ABT9XI48_9BACL|nr:hypothetical protein [Alicyclobacillus cycloheptanicus]MDQ0189785.1 hypothetical protein [Alicyclobacillus cycloheptanicus]WDM01988.1 hypothetical protein JI721_03880 [Alicyclobacillus cycloheptanicus]
MRNSETLPEKTSSVVRNERVTALAGAILFVLILIELVITANLHSLISVHVFVGVLLSGPLVVKMSSVGYRFFGYYMGSPAFVQKGAPNIWLRLLSPILVIMTILVFVSGFGLAIVGPTHMGLWFKIHAASVALWLPLIAVHIYAHIKRVPGLIASDWRRQFGNQVSGRAGRLGINVIGLAAGAVAALMMIPVSAPWRHWIIHPGLPSPLVLGIIAAVIVILVAIPLLRTTR